MKILESDISNQIIKFVENEVGSIFFLKHIAVVEINEGVHFDINNAPKIIDELNFYFKDSKAYGVVANRINSYSVNLVHALSIKKMAKNLFAYGVVGHDLAGKMNASIENGFCTSEKIDYDNLLEAVNSVSRKIKKSAAFF
ncbi:MAG: hypothetical protein ABJM36_08920 [Algibacter sp.]|uniref:hypothetical protein n=1 Tax=Algibacter sp. TaxID=1872428 RepID=UPI003297BAEB